MALNIVRFKRTGDFDPLCHKSFKVINVTVLTAQSEVTNSIFKGCTRRDQIIWKIKHFFERCITDCQPKVTVEYGQGLPDQIQTSSRHSMCSSAIERHVWPLSDRDFVPSVGR